MTAMNALTDAPRVYSYTRFSTPEQAQGDSRRRQLDSVSRWIERRNAERKAERLPPLVLDDTLNLHDPGISAYRGRNVDEDRGLGGFLFACRQGLIASGSFLLVESLDRISRMTPRRVSRMLDDIVDAGVVIVTMSDGQEYDAHRLDGDPTSLLISLMVSWRAHEESKVKGLRVSAAWAEKRRRVREGLDPMLTRRGPAWLEWKDGVWRERKPHADTVRRIYRMTIEGLGEGRIATALNGEGVPVMGRGRMWHRTTIAKLLRNPAAIGILTPGWMEYGTGKRVRKLEDGIPDAFPAVVSQGDWLAVRAIKDGKTPAARGRGARVLANFLAGLARCPDCGSTMTRVSKGRGSKGGRPKLVCTRAKVGAADHSYHSVPLDELEDAFAGDWQAILADVPAGEAGNGLDAEHTNLSAVISATEDDLESLTDLLQREPSRALASRIRSIEAQLVSLRDDLAQLEEAREIADHGLVAARVGTLQEAMQEGGLQNIPRVNAALKALFEGVTIDHQQGLMSLHWRQGGNTDIRFAWPEKE